MKFITASHWIEESKTQKKIVEGNNLFVNTLVSSNEEIFDFLKENAATRDKSYEMVQLRMQNQAKNSFKRNGMINLFKRLLNNYIN